MRRCTEPLDLLKHVPDATEHGDGAVKVFEQMLEVDNDVIDRFAELLFKPLLNGPAGQASDGTRRLWHLAFQQGHDFRGQEVAGRCSDVINRSLNHLQGSFDRSVKHRDRVPEASSVFEAFQHRAQALEGRVVVKQGLCKRFFGEACAQALCFLNVCEGFFVSLRQGGGFVDQSGQLSLCMTATSTEIAQLTQYLSAFVHEFSQFCLDVGTAGFVLRSSKTVLFSALTRVLFLGANRLEFKVAHVNLFLSGDEVGLGTSVSFTAGVDLFTQHPKTALFILALLSNGAEALTPFGKVGLKFGFLQRELLKHRLEFCTAFCIANRFRKLSSSLTDLVLKFVDSSHKAFSTGFCFFPL